MHIPIYTITKRLVLFFGLLSVLPTCLSAQTGKVEELPEKPLLLYFRFDKVLVDSGYKDNLRTLHHLDEWLTNRDLIARIDSVSILSFASPDGNRAYNERLARQRATAVKGYLVWKYPHFDQTRIHPRPQGENWQELRRLIVEDRNLPDKKEVLQIIDRIKNTERCKALLMKLSKGIPYRYIARHLLPQLRNAAVCMVWIKPDTLSPLPRPSSPVNTLPEVSYKQPESNVSVISHRAEKRTLFALKTNLLFDLAMAPNIEVEVPIGSRWSVSGEWMFPWWLFKGDKYCFQVLSGGLEGRYWLGKRENHRILAGHFLGLYAEGGKYDLQWDSNGYQGEFYIASGISYGYSAPISKHLNLEFSLGIGLLRTDYRHYHTQHNYQTLLWQENGKYTWFGPTKAKISLVWLLGRKTKKGGAR